MGKRSNFFRRANDDYPTPAKAVCPLLPHVKEGRTFIEPCAGTGQLTKHLAEAGLIPLRPYDISQGYDARVIEYPHDAEFFITNPPWTRQLQRLASGNSLDLPVPHFKLQTVIGGGGERNPRQHVP